MPLYTGKSADGSDMTEFEGLYINPNNENEWSNTPYPSQLPDIRTKNEVLDYMNTRYTLDDVYLQIQNKNCLLNKRCRNFVLSHYDENGNFIENN